MIKPPLTNEDLVCVCAIPRLGQGGETAPQALSGRFDSVSEVPYGIRCASRKSIRMLRDFEPTAPPAPSAPGCPALTKAGSCTHRDDIRVRTILLFRTALLGQRGRASLRLLAE